MKEATGEANITVITIVLIAIVLAVGTVIVNSVLNNAKKTSCCNSVGGIWKKGRCWHPSSNCTTYVQGQGCYAVATEGYTSVAGSQGARNRAYQACINE